LRTQAAELDKCASEEITHVIHGPQLHKIELELQNEELRPRFKGGNIEITRVRGGTVLMSHQSRSVGCKMAKEACVGRQLLAISPQQYRLSADAFLLSDGFYPECCACARGRRLARFFGINPAVLRRHTATLRERIEQSSLIGFSIRLRHP